MKKAILLFCVLCFYSCIYAQVTARIDIVKGFRLDFIVNSLTKYEDGIVYADFTQLNISFEDLAAVPAGWELSMRAIQPNIDGDMTNQFLTLETLLVSVSVDGATSVVGGANVIDRPLSTTPFVIAEGNAVSGATENKSILISYKCGTDAHPLMNKVPDYYFVDLEFTLKSK